jgi:sugar transferase (PEP-CTERM/EpsH1 system associated)
MPRPRRIVHLVLSLDVGGLERIVLDLAAHADRSRFDLEVMALDAPGAQAPELARMGIPLRVVRRAPGLDARLPLALSRLLRRAGADLIHTHNASPHLYGALGARIARGVRVVHTKHGRNAPGSPRKVLVNRIASAITDRVVAVSEDAARLAIDVERVDARRVLTIHNGVDTQRYRPRGAETRRAARARLGVPDGAFHVGCVARLAAVKDHPTLLRAFALLRGRVPGAYLTIAGDGPERSVLEATAAALDLAGSITFAGEVADVDAILPAFDAFALASRSEGISLTLLEAASAGLPVVATRVGGTAEIVVEGVTGLLVPPRDPSAFAAALAALARSPGRASLGAAGRARVEDRFSVERMTRAYEALYDELLEGRAAG